MSVYLEEIPLVTRKSSRSGVLLPSVGQYVGVLLIGINSFVPLRTLVILCLFKVKILSHNFTHKNEIRSLSTF